MQKSEILHFHGINKEIKVFVASFCIKCLNYQIYFTTIWFAIPVNLILDDSKFSSEGVKSHSPMNDSSFTNVQKVCFECISNARNGGQK